MALLPVNPEARVLRIVAPLAWTAGLLGLSRAAACVRIAPILGLLRGPLGLLLVALAVGLALAAALPRPRRIAPSPGLLFGAAWALLLVVGLSYTLRLRVSGDEPHYLLMAQSLWREHDLDLRDNHAREDWREYTPGPITPHYGAPRVDGRPYPAHSPGLALLAVVRLRGPARIAFLAVAAAMGAGFLLYYRAIFGVASPLAIYGGLPRDADGSPLRALAGLFLDRSFGLLPYAPVFLIALAGLGRLVRLRAWEPLLVGAAVIAPVLPWRMWWGGQCPPARVLVPLVPVLALALAARVAVSRTGLARWRWPLALLGIATTIGMTIRPAALLLLNRGDRPTRLWAALSGERPIGTYLPSLMSASPDEWRIAVVWLAALALLFGLDAAARRRERIDRLFRGLGLPIVLLLGVGMAVDDWARRTPPETMKAVTPDEAPE